MKRSDLDRVAREFNLDEAAVATALDLSGGRPDPAAWRTFGVRVLNAAGFASLGAGAIFFVAANWQEFGVAGRFVLLQVAFAGSVALAWWRAPPDPIATAAIALATLLIGGLLALFGQTYQTGADVFELFLTWAALALPFALGGRSGAVWAIWWVVLNIAFALYGGWLGPQHFLWAWLDRAGVGRPLMLLVPCAVNFIGAALFAHLAKTSPQEAPRWLVRMLLAFGFIYGTAASMLATVGHGWASSRGNDAPVQDALVIGAFAAACVAIAFAALRSKRDVFPLAAIIGSGIAISTALLIKGVKFNDVGGFFIVAAWLIATSSAASFVLMHWVREWNARN
jgi:uncharacterized membrane protein